MAPLAFLCASTYAQATCLLTLMAFFVLGMHAGYAIYFPELFPTRLRATGSSVCFNLGRVLGAVILIVRGTIGLGPGLALGGRRHVGIVPGRTRDLDLRSGDARAGAAGVMTAMTLA